MNLKINYYEVLSIENTCGKKEIRDAYFNLSKIHHPDKGGDSDKFNIIKEAYDILSSKKRIDYDKKSIYGANYDSYYELFNVDEFSLDTESLKDTRSKILKFQINDIEVEIDENFDGYISYERFVKCNKCEGTGHDSNAKIEIKGKDGKIHIFDAEDGCDFCEGTGEYMDKPCSFCGGVGKTGLVKCKKCKGDKRILGIQKLKYKSKGDNDIVKFMGSYSITGQVGDLYINIKKDDNKSD